MFYQSIHAMNGGLISREVDGERSLPARTSCWLLIGSLMEAGTVVPVSLIEYFMPVRIFTRQEVWTLHFSSKTIDHWYHCMQGRDSFHSSFAHNSIFCEFISVVQSVSPWERDILPLNLPGKAFTFLASKLVAVCQGSRQTSRGRTDKLVIPDPGTWKVTDAANGRAVDRETSMPYSILLVNFKIDCQ